MASMKALQTKIHEAMLLLKSAAQDVEKSTSLDPVFSELATGVACAGRALRMLKQRAIVEGKDP